MFNSYDKDKFVVGKEYYTYYMDVTNRGNGIKDYTGIMKVKVLSNDPTDTSPDGYTIFEILESKKLGDKMSHSIHYYMNGYGMASTNFYETKDECIEAHDAEVKEIAKGQTTNDRERILKKLINKGSKPKAGKKETDAISWYNTLSHKEKKHVKWIKEFWDDIK
jgi:hypothetical protein